MPKTAKAIADDLFDRLQKSEKSAITIPWPDMYTVCERERLKETFLESLRREVRKRFIVIAYGDNVVFVLNDTNFSPFNKAK